MSSKSKPNVDDLWSNEENIAMDLHTGAGIGCEEKVRDIIENLENKGSLNSQNKDGWTPLMYAAYSGDQRVVLILLEEGACVKTKNNKGQTPLMLASKYGNTDSAAFLIENGANIDECDLQRWTAMFYASSSGHRSVVQLLIERGAYVNISETRRGLTPLMFAAAAGHEMIVKDLLQYGASLTATSSYGETARSLAVQNNHTKVKIAIDAHSSLKQNYFPSATRSQGSAWPMNLFGLLDHLGLTKYYPFFENHNIDLAVFWTLTDKDLKEIGIELLGPRKKLTAAIARWQQNFPLTGNLEEQAIVNKLMEDCRELKRHVSEFNLLFTQEKNRRIATELRLAEGIQTQKCYAEKVQTIATCSKLLEASLKGAYFKLKDALRGSGNSPNVDVNRYNIKWRNNIIEIVEYIGNLIEEIRHQTMLL